MNMPALTRPSTATLSFRSATEADLPALRELYRQLIPGVDPSIEDMRLTLAEMQADRQGGMVVVGTLDGRVVSTCQIVVYPNLVRTPRIKAQIDSVVVDAAVRGHGIGRKMMTWSMEHLRSHHCSKIIVATSYSREVAHKLYSALGFEEFGFSFVYSDHV